MQKKSTPKQVENVKPSSTGSFPGEQKKTMNRSQEPVAAEDAEDRLDARDKVSQATRDQSDETK